MELHERIQGWHHHLRPDLGASRTAELMGVSQTTIFHWWSGKYKPTHIHLTEYVERVLRMSMAEFWSAVPAPRRAS